MRALALGDQAGLRAFMSAGSAASLAQARRDAHSDAAELQRLAARLIALGDSEYPAGLRDLSFPPAFICVRGRLPRGGVAIVGTREPSDAGRQLAFDLARGLKRPVVSGLALGIDAAVHRGALAAGVPQVAYVSTGLARVYPPEHAALSDELVAAGGAIASERLPEDGVTRWSLVKRDRLQAAHAAAVVLVESEPDGGAMHTMRFARELGRPRFVCGIDAGGNRAARDDGAAPLSANLASALETIIDTLPAQEIT